jgi:hypothetical protein
MTQPEPTEPRIVEVLLREPEFVAWLEHLPTARMDVGECDDEPPCVA